ncbi:MAG: fibronectin type III domain-containing protein [bacterium]|nr:fibronectin type III domain-containing protein [bacterium]
MKTHFQEIIFTLWLPLLLISFLVPATSHALAPIDQECGTEGLGNGLVGYSRNTRTTPDYQLFVPTKNTLDAISIRVSGPTTALRMEVIDTINPPYRTIASMMKSFDGYEQWLTFDFADVPMPRSAYVIALSNVNSGMTYYWKYRTDCYANGHASMNGEYQGDKDFGFAVYAYDSADTSGNGANPGGSGSNPGTGNPPSGGNGLPPASSGNTVSPIGTSAGTQKPPSAQTSSAILPPTGLTATDTELDYGGAIDLGWKASSTTDIDGYKVFRRAEGDSEYVEILRLPKTFTKFTDPWATKDKTYYYMLRSYKGTQESANSNVASATSKDDLTGLKKDILDDYKKNGGGGGIIGDAFKNPVFIIVPVIIVLMIIGLFILGLWVLFHKKKQPTPPTQSK